MGPGKEGGGYLGAVIRKVCDRGPPSGLLSSRDLVLVKALTHVFIEDATLEKSVDGEVHRALGEAGLLSELGTTDTVDTLDYGEDALLVGVHTNLSADGRATLNAEGRHDGRPSDSRERRDSGGGRYGLCLSYGLCLRVLGAGVAVEPDVENDERCLVAVDVGRDALDLELLLVREGVE
jgi:hypothetical protein